MASEVTKRIKGRDYRYVVDSYRDPHTNRRKQRWQYVGVLDNGTVRAGNVKRRNQTTRDNIIDATARLLKFRAPKHITVSVIAASAGASRSVFYRHFPNAKEVITEALAQIANDAFRALPSLGAPRTLEEAKEQLREWCRAFNYSAGLNLMGKHVVLQSYRRGVRARLKAAQTNELQPTALLSAFFKRLNNAGLTAIENPEALAESVRGLHTTLRLSMYAVMPDEEHPLPDYDAFYPLIERAVFGVPEADPHVRRKVSVHRIVSRLASVVGSRRFSEIGSQLTS